MTQLTILTATELRLMTREWAAMVFAFAFPVLLMLILAGVFGTEVDPDFGGVTPAEYYVADYVAVPLGAMALIGLPVMLATYRERSILRRFEAAGVPTRTVIGAQAVVTVVLVVLAAVTVLLVAAPTYGVPAVHDGLGVAAGFALGTAAMISVGVVLGLIAGTARSAQALGLLAFLPMWILGAGGPPRAVMPDVMIWISDALPLGHVAQAIREPWLDTGDSGMNLAALGLWLVGCLVAITILLRRRAS